MPDWGIKKNTRIPHPNHSPTCVVCPERSTFYCEKPRPQQSPFSPSLPLFNFHILVWLLPLASSALELGTVAASAKPSSHPFFFPHLLLLLRSPQARPYVLGSAPTIKQDFFFFFSFLFFFCCCSCCLCCECLFFYPDLSARP